LHEAALPFSKAYHHPDRAAFRRFAGTSNSMGFSQLASALCKKTSLCQAYDGACEEDSHK